MVDRPSLVEIPRRLRTGSNILTYPREIMHGAGCARNLDEPRWGVLLRIGCDSRRCCCSEQARDK